MKRLWFCITVILGAICLAGAGAAQERGEIRLTPLLSNLPSRVAVAPNGSFVAVSARDGTVSVFDLNIVKASREQDLLFSPIRDEESEKERPVAVSPDGDLIAIGAPLERGKPGTGRIYFFKSADKKRVIFTIDGLPSRPLALHFSSDRKNRLRLAAALADREAPRVWDISELRELARDSARPVAALDPPAILPEPIPGFFAGCGRAASDCQSWTAVFPPAQSEIALAVGSDSGLVLYRDDFDGFKVLAYAYLKDQPELGRVRSVSFSPEGTHFAVGRLAASPADTSACQVQVYDVKALLADAAKGPKLTQRPTVLSPPELIKDKESWTDGCNFAAVAWSGNTIFAAGLHIRVFDRSKCTTFSVLHEDYEKDEANAMLQWQFPGNGTIRKICVGTNTAMDVQPFGSGGAAIATQDPFVTVFGPDGETSLYPGRARHPRNFEGPILDLRDGTRGDLTVSADATAVLVRPLRSPAAYVAFDLSQLLTDPLSARALELNVLPNAKVMGDLKQELIKEIAARRNAALDLSDQAASPSTCFGLTLPPVSVHDDLDQHARAQLKLRSGERVRAVEFLPPARSGEEWRAVIGTSYRLIHVDCAQRDLWHDGRLMRDVAIPGVPVRDDAYQVRVSKDRRFIVAAHGNGLLRWYHLASGKLALSVFVHQGLESWVAWTPDGYFDSSRNAGSGLAGWLRSIAQPAGTWSVTVEPLANFEREWRRPGKLREAMLGTGGAPPADKPPPDKAPNSGKPIIAVSVPPHESVTTSEVPFRIVVQNYDGDPRRKVALYVEQLGPISLDRAESGPEKDYRVITGTFRLNDCMQKHDRRWRIWVQWDGPDVQSSSNVFVYTGQPSQALCPRPKVWGIFVGISNYATEPLSYAHQDAKRFFDYWNETQTFYERRRLVLLSAPPKESAKLKVIVNGKEPEPPAVAPDMAWNALALRRFISDELHKMTDEADGLGNSDLLVIYLAGHGVSHRAGDQELWSFLPSDGDINADRTLLHADWLSGALANMNKASSILLVVDACRHYATSYRPGLQGSPISALTALSATHNAAVFVGAAAGGSSFEFPKSDLITPPHPQSCQPSATETEGEGGGSFTHVLLRELQDGVREDDGSIHVYDLASRLRGEVRKICRQQEVTFNSSTRSFRSLFPAQ